MARRTIDRHPEPMVDVIALIFTGLAFLVLVAAVPIELGEERQDEHEARAQR